MTVASHLQLFGAGNASLGRPLVFSSNQSSLGVSLGLRSSKALFSTDANPSSSAAAASASTSTPTSTSTTNQPTEPVKELSWFQRTYNTIKKELKHYKEGSKQLGRNIAACFRLIREKRTTPFTRRERALLVKTAGDLFRLVPFAVIVVVPFMEFSLPILLKIFPNMLPSTFTSQSQRQTNAQKSLAAKIEVVKFLQETMDELTHSVQFDSDADLKAFHEFVDRIRKGEFIEKPELEQYASKLRGEFSVERLGFPQLRALCRFFGIPTVIGSAFLMREALNLKISRIYSDDETIDREGVKTLSSEELEEAALVRGITINKNTASFYSNFDALTEERRQRLTSSLEDWVSLTRSNIPIFLHILARMNVLERATPIVSSLVSAAEDQKQHQEVIDQVVSATIAEKIAIEEAQPPQPLISGFGDVKKMLLPQLIELKAKSDRQKAAVPSDASAAAHTAIDRLQKNINSMVEELQTELAEQQQQEKQQPQQQEKQQPLPQQPSQQPSAESSTPESMKAAQKELEDRHITPAAESFIKAVFRIFDLNGDGSVSLEELTLGMAQLGIEATPEQIQSIFDTVDVDKNGVIDSDEFVECVLILRDWLHEQQERELKSTAPSSEKTASSKSSTPETSQTSPKKAL